MNPCKRLEKLRERYLKVLKQDKIYDFDVKQFKVASKQYRTRFPDWTEDFKEMYFPKHKYN